MTTTTRPYSVIKVEILDGFPSAVEHRVILGTYGSRAAAERRLAWWRANRPDERVEIRVRKH